MRQTLIFSLAALLFFTACEPENQVTFTGTISSNTEDAVILKQSVANRMVTLDSIAVETDGSFEVKATVAHPDFLTLSGTNGSYLFYAEPGDEIGAEFEKNLGQVEKLTGPKASVEFYEVNQYAQGLNEKRNNLNQRYQQGEIGRQEAVTEFNQINQEWKEFATDFVETNPTSPAVLSALNVFHPVEDMDVFKNTLAALKPTMGQSDYLKRLEEQIGKAQQQAAQYKAQKKAQEAQNKKLAVGKEAPEISLPTPEGKTLALSDLRGKYVLVDFWASWCKPCRRENPNVVAAYKKYKNKGFEILSVSLDKNKTAWVNAIKADNMNWKHVSDLKFWSSEAARTYGVSSIPFTLLLDKEGKIVAKNLRGAALHNKLDELLNA